MQARTKLLLVIMLLVFATCGLPDTTDNWYYTPEILKFKFDNHPAALYKFATSSMYNDSYLTGYTILDTNQTFTLNGLKKLDFDFLKQLPTNDTLRVIKLVTAKDRLNVKREPVRTSFAKHKGFVVHIEYLEKYNGYSSVNGSAQRFTFSSLKEKPDSLIFYDPISRYKTNLHQNADSIILPKRNLYIYFDRDSKPESISAELLIEDEADLFVYKKGGRVIESTVKNGFVRLKRSYEFTPADSTVVFSLSGTGLFTEVK